MCFKWGIVSSGHPAAARDGKMPGQADMVSRGDQQWEMLRSNGGVFSRKGSVRPAQAFPSLAPLSVFREREHASPNSARDLC